MGKTNHLKGKIANIIGKNYEFMRHWIINRENRKIYEESCKFHKKN